jgi:hypothetical protein
MTQRFGAFIEREAGSGEYLRISFSPSSVPIQQRWRNNGLSADFLADYLSTFFPGEDPASSERQAEIKNAVSYLANELLENAMKFTYAPSQYPVSIEMFLEADVISLYVTNCLDPNTLEGFQAYIERLLREDPDELYLERLERHAQDDHTEASGLGFLTMLNDYGATLAWEFSDTAHDANGVAVTTMVQLAV